MKVLLSPLLACMMPMLFANTLPQGWHWYNVPVTTTQPSISNLTPTEQLKVIQQGYDEAKAQAILYPTESNVTLYLEMQQFMTDHASDFAAMWPEVLLDHPELNYHITHPTEQAVSQAINGQKTSDEVTAVQALAAQNGILFFYRGNQQIDQEMAQNIANFAKTYNIAVLPVSVDGNVLTSIFQNSKVDHGEAAKLGIQYFPAVILFNDQTKKVQPIAYGYLAQDELLQQFLLVYSNFKAEF